MSLKRSSNRSPWIWQCAIFLLLPQIVPMSLMGGVGKLAPLVDAHIYLVKSGDEMLTVVGAVSNDQVSVLLPNKERKTVSYRQLNWVDKQLPPVGRVTICATEGRSEGETVVSEDFVSNTGSMSFTFELVADRDISDCYVALILEFSDKPDKKYISLGKIGDLPAGELVKRDVFFPRFFARSDGSYNFEFYRGGFPLEMFRLERVADHPGSHSLLIPWELRLEQYLSTARERNSTNPLRPFHRTFSVFDVSAVKSRGVQQVRVTLLVKENGAAELVRGDPQLTDEELASLSRDVQKWRFFPSVKEGSPYAMKVAVPLNF